MGWPVYTERLLSTATHGVWVVVTIPVGKRAVVRNIDAVDGAGGSGIQVVVGGRYVSLHVFQAAGEYHFETRAVAYGGETIEAALGSADQQLLVTGYVFDDSTSATGPLLEQSYRTLGEAAPLPEW